MALIVFSLRVWRLCPAWGKVVNIVTVIIVRGGAHNLFTPIIVEIVVAAFQRHLFRCE